MGVLKMSPYVLHVSEATEGHVDVDGNYHPGTIEYSPYVKCDVVPSGQPSERDFGDGVMVSYSHTVYVYDMRCRDFVRGERIAYSLNGVLSGEYVVKGFNRYQTYCIMWI